jgi:PAS domain S-box-containing protein
MPAKLSEPEMSAPPYPGEDPIERIILKSMNEGVITLECNGTVHTVNPAALSILGLSEDCAKGKNFQQVLGDEPENREFIDIFRGAIEANSVSKRRETRYKRGDGQTVDLSVSSAYLEIDACEPELQSVVVVFRDITAFKSLERIKRRAVNHLSHELKTPLAIAEASISSLIQNDVPRDQALKRLKRARRNLERLNAIQAVVEEVFNPPRFQPRLLNVSAFVDQVLDRIRNASAHRDVSLTSCVKLRETDRLDPFWLQTTLDTLIRNSIENTPDGGQVTVSLSEQESGILLKVEDSGVGILIQDQEFIFEGFVYTQSTEDYASKKPYDFNAGGKGLELLRLKVLSESGPFDIWFESRRCEHLPSDRDGCPGNVSSCPRGPRPKDCRNSGGTTFFVLFH